MNESKEELEQLDKEIMLAYMEKHKLRIVNFRRDNPGKALPIFKDANGLPCWVNRNGRRKKKNAA